MRYWMGLVAAALLAGCTGHGGEPASMVDAAAQPPVQVKIIAFNDVHGNLEAGKLSVEAGADNVRVPAGGGA